MWAPLRWHVPCLATGQQPTLDCNPPPTTGRPVTIHARVRVGDLMEEHPEVDEVLENYDIEATDEVMAMTLKQLCRSEGVNYWEIKADIVEAVGWDGSAEYDASDDEDDEDDWLDNDDDKDQDEDIPDADVDPDDDGDDDDDDDDDD